MSHFHLIMARHVLLSLLALSHIDVCVQGFISNSRFRSRLVPSVVAHTSSQSRLYAVGDSYADLRVMINGMPGPMATAAAEACLRKGLTLAPIGLTGPDIEPSVINVVDNESGKSASVRLIPSSSEEEKDSALIGLKIGAGGGNLVAIDYTHPSAVNGNAKWYVENKLPFVMGTTGGDREQLMTDVGSGDNFAVIAPNMGKQIVAMQAALEELAVKYPMAFEGYKLEVTESHQKTKADTSGTAKAVIGSILELSGDNFDVESDVNMIRDDDKSMAFGVSKEALNGHAFHTYTLTSADASVQFALQHNVEGRTVYAEGTADAVKFLYKKIGEGGSGKIYSMINVLEEGALE
uniref:4-hydroxy-tetrahydrodipicolinate reductase n=2 Tax=Corethron hystrix TaxID=216773 RepID=A0A7S1BBW7_9STRA|mmetsp:Transcript_21163/g.48043  ORF Transcript_21163/g.48043 Transcript_21163/m.48043 type:complete len:350 (+) Transcript_21163:63-1112(+)